MRRDPDCLCFWKVHVSSVRYLPVYEGLSCFLQVMQLSLSKLSLSTWCPCSMSWSIDEESFHCFHSSMPLSFASFLPLHLSRGRYSVPQATVTTKAIRDRLIIKPKNQETEAAFSLFLLSTHSVNFTPNGAEDYGGLWKVVLQVLQPKTTQRDRIHKGIVSETGLLDCWVIC